MINAFVDRLKTELKTTDRRVKVDKIARLAEMRTPPPAVGVVIGGEAPEPRDRSTIGPHRQRVTVEVSCFLYVAALTGGARAGDDVDVLRGAVEDALLGWVHPDAQGHKTSYVRGRLVPGKDGQLIWQSIFQTQRIAKEKN